MLLIKQETDYAEHPGTWGEYGECLRARERARMHRNLRIGAAFALGAGLVCWFVVDLYILLAVEGLQVTFRLLGWGL